MEERRRGSDGRGERGGEEGRVVDLLKFLERDGGGGGDVRGIFEWIDEGMDGWMDALKNL